MALIKHLYAHWGKALTTLLLLSVVLYLPVSAQHKAAIPLQQRILQQIDQNDSSIHVSGASDTVVPYLINKQEKLSLEINRIGSFYRHGLDTLPISMQLPRVEKTLSTFRTLLDNKGKRLNLRSLNSLLVLMQESVDNLKDWQTTLDGYSSEMNSITESVERVVQDSTIKTLPADTSLFRLAVAQLRDIDAKYKSVDTLERLGLTRVGLLQNRVEGDYLEATSLVDEINYRMKVAKRQLWNREEPGLWNVQRSDYKTNLWDDLAESITRGLRVTGIYMTSTWDTRSITLIVLLLLIIWCWINLRKVKKRPDRETSLAPVHFLSHSIFVSCLVLVVTFGAFLESNIPMSYLHLTGLLHLAGITILLRPYLTKRGKELGIWGIVLWLGYSLDDLLGETTYGERWLLLGGAIMSIILCLRLLRFRDDLVEGITFPPVLKPLVSLTLLMSMLSLFFDITGRTTLSKLIGVSGIHSLIYAVTLWVSSTIVLEMIYLQSEAYKDSRFSAFLNFSELQQRFQYFLRLLTGLFWFSLLLRNMSVFEPVYDFVLLVINKPRTLGSMSFSLGSVFVFILILWISSILSQFVNFLFGQEASQGQTKRRNVAAIALMGRLGILAIGFLIAVGAAGIPLDKISFIIGALGVGIGFGMQTIVNNLVSGIILAFERPIQVGDQIEVSGKAGTVREIGIRASKISNGEGADIIIPNGDLLSQTLTNWTLSNRNRRVGFTVRTTRDVDLGKITNLIRGVLTAHTDIMASPGPSVQITAFGGSWVEFQILFWSEDLGNTGGLTHAIISELSAMFAKEKIDLANPGQDIYIRSEPDGSRLGEGGAAADARGAADPVGGEGLKPPPAGPAAS